MPTPDISSTSEDRRYLFFALGGSLVALSLQLLLPLSCDDEIYQSMAKELLGFHWLPYLGSWDQNFPGIVYLHALSILLFGDSAMGFRLFDLLVHLLMSWMLYRLLRQWLTPRMCFLGVMLYNLHYLAGAFTTVGQRDSFAAFFLLGGTLLLYQKRNGANARTPFQSLSAFTSGFCFAMMFVLRGTYATFPLIALVFLSTARPRNVSKILAFSYGACILLLAVFLPYVFIRDGLKQVYLSIGRFNLEIYGQLRYSLAPLLTELRNQKLFLLLGLAGVSLISVRSLRLPPRIRRVIDHLAPLPTRDRALLLSYALAAILSIVVMGKYFSEHFEPLLLVIIPFGAIALESLFALFPRRSYKVMIAVLLLLYYSIRVAPNQVVHSYVASLLRGAPHPLNIVYDAYSDTGYLVSADRSIASYIDRTTPPDARIECVSWNAGVRWRTSRACASRYTTFYSLATSAPDGTHPNFQKKWRQEYIDSLRIIRPSYLILSSVREHKFGLSNSPLNYLRQIPGFDSEILPHYRFDTIIGTYVLLKRQE